MQELKQDLKLEVGTEAEAVEDSSYQQLCMLKFRFILLSYTS